MAGAQHKPKSLAIKDHLHTFQLASAGNKCWVRLGEVKSWKLSLEKVHFRSSSSWTFLGRHSLQVWIYRPKEADREREREWESGNVIFYCNNEGFPQKLTSWSWKSSTTSLWWEREQTRRREEKSSKKVSLENFIKNFWLLLNISKALKRRIRERWVQQPEMREIWAKEEDKKREKKTP